MESTHDMLTEVGDGILKRRFVIACRRAKQKKNEVEIISEEDFIKQSFLKLYAKLQGKQLMESQHHVLTKVGHGILKKRFVFACRCALTKKQMKST